ncbi:MAG: hypothetical protein JWP44_1530 [Mucilaginibacter sp.]|nr:hypothetical protein [Mucilaginibacter sp.]
MYTLNLQHDTLVSLQNRCCKTDIKRILATVYITKVAAYYENKMKRGF